MPKSNKKLNTEDIGILFFIAALIFGGWFRIYVPLTAGFPVNDGGLFYKMIEAIQANHYLLPEYVRYNGVTIPFAYPPLAFYLAGVFTQIFHLTLFDALQWLPAIILIAVIPAFYFLASLVLSSRFQAGLAALLFAFLPSSIAWTIMGGGITRALGQLFLVLTVSNLYLLYTKQHSKYLVTSILLSSLVCLTHPEAAVHTIAIALLLWVLYGRNKSGTIRSLLVAAGTLILTSPWWITTLSRFGPEPILSATRTSLHGLHNAFALFVPFSGEPFLTIIILLAFLGLTARIAQGKYLLPLWYVLPFIVEPRSAANVAVIPMGLLAAVALAELIFPMLARMEGMARNLQLENMLQSRAEKLLFVYFMGCLLIGMQYYSMGHAQKRVSPGIRDSFDWVRVNTPAESRFLILTGTTDLFQDFTNEWFPVFTDRTSLTTIQGYEWVGGNQFSERVPVMQKFQRCAAAVSALDCVEELAEDTDIAYDHILIARKTSATSWGDSLIFELKNSKKHALDYESDEVVIFERLE